MATNTIAIDLIDPELRKHFDAALFGAHDVDDAHALVTLRNEGRAA